MPELGPYGSVRGARGNSRPYRESDQHTAKVKLMTHFGPWLPIRGCQLTEARRTLWLGVQVVKTSAELLHFHSTPPALESSVGGVELIGAKSAAQARVRNATMSKDRFIGVLPISGVRK